MLIVACPPNMCFVASVAIACCFSCEQKSPLMGRHSLNGNAIAGRDMNAKVSIDSGTVSQSAL